MATQPFKPKGCFNAGINSENPCKSTRCGETAMKTKDMCTHTGDASIEYLLGWTRESEQIQLFYQLTQHYGMAMDIAIVIVYQRPSWSHIAVDIRV